MANNLYACDLLNLRIVRYDTDGSNEANMIAYLDFSPHGIFIDPTNDHIYWTDTGSDTIRRSDRNGSFDTEIFSSTSGTNSPIDIDVDVSGGKIYWVNQLAEPSFHRANLDGSSAEKILGSGDGFVNPRSLALHLPSGKIFLCDRDIDKIQRCDLDGSNLEDVVTSGLGNPEGVAVDTSADKVYWTDGTAGKIERADLDGSNRETVVSGLGLPVHVALHVASGKMYWADYTADKIQRSNLDGSSQEDIITGTTEPWGVALDLTAGKVYWFDRSNDRLRRADLDGSNPEDVAAKRTVWPQRTFVDTVANEIYFTDTNTGMIKKCGQTLPSGETATNRSDLEVVVRGMSQLVGLAVDLSNSKIYWSDDGTNKIQRANLDGSSIEDLVTSGLTNPEGLALDLTANKLYWVDRGTDKIERSNLDGSSRETLIDTGLDYPRDIDLDITNGKMYWTDRTNDVIQKANLDGSSVETIVSGLNNPVGIALELDISKVYWADQSANKIQRSNFDGSSVEDIVTSGLSSVRGVSFDLASTLTATGNVDLFLENFLASEDTQRLFIQGTNPPGGAGQNRTKKTNPKWLIGYFSGSIVSVTVEIWNLLTGQQLTLDDDTCYQIGNTSYWRWNINNMPDGVSTGQFLFRMTANTGATYHDTFTLT